MLHVRLIVPDDRSDEVADGLGRIPGVVHVVRAAGRATRPQGDVVLCDVPREAANDVVEWLQEHEIDRLGAITVDAIDITASTAAAMAELRAPGEGTDALVWEQVEAQARIESRITVSFLVYMSVAAMIAAIGILLDSPILVIGAMVVGPEYGPLSALCVGVVRRSWTPGATAAATLAIGLGVAALAAFAGTLLLRWSDIAPDSYGLGERELTAFIARPDAMTAVVAVLAGIVGMLALTESRGQTLLGVLVAVTTLPAAGNVGAAAAYRAWSDVGGAAAQLGINLLGLVVAGVATLAVQARLTTQRLAVPPTPAT